MQIKFLAVSANYGDIEPSWMVTSILKTHSTVKWKLKMRPFFNLPAQFTLSKTLVLHFLMKMVFSSKNLAF